jgi:hypothetical protein
MLIGKELYQSLGWRLDADIVVGEFQVVQLTPQRSKCSISFGKGITNAQPGSAQRLELVVSNIDVAREDLISRGVEVSELFHRDESGLAPGPDPNVAPTSLMPHSAIRMATGAYCRRSRSASGPGVGLTTHTADPLVRLAQLCRRREAAHQPDHPTRADRTWPLADQGRGRRS